MPYDLRLPLEIIVQVNLESGDACGVSWSNVNDFKFYRQGRLFASGADEVEFGGLYKKVVDVADIRNGLAVRELHYKLKR